MKKLIIVVTILSFLNLIGCYYQEQMNPKDYSFDESNDIKITTRDTVYNFKGNHYSLVSDTLIGIMPKILDERTTLNINIGIPVEDMEEVEVDRSDALLTTLTTIGAVVGVIFILAVASYGK